MKNNLKLIIFILFLFVVGTVFPSTASAVTLTPTRFEVNANAGDVLEEELTIINEGENEETFYSSYSNFEAQGESGTPSFVEPKDGLGTWIETESPSVTLSAGEQRKFKFKIHVPKDAEPGGHFAVVFFGTTQPSKTNGQVGIGSKTGVLVLLSVSGDVEVKGGLLSFLTKGKQFFYKTLPVSFEYRFQNDGNDRLKPVGDITIHNMLYIPTKTLDANNVEGNILPKSTRKFSIDWQEYERPLDYIYPEGFWNTFWDNVSFEWKNFAWGFYVANLNLAYSNPEFHVSKTTFFFVFPWELTIVMIVVLALIYFIGRTFIRRYNRYIIEQAKAGTHTSKRS